MVFAPEANQEIVLDLSGGGTYILQVLDTWTMEVKEEKAIDAGEF